MKKLDLHGIKQANAKAIFLSAASRDKISRADIASGTGLSLMTVGKVVDVLLEAGIVSQHKEDRVSAGRRAGLLTLRAERYSVVIDLSERAFRINIVDLALKLSDSMTYKYNPKYMYDENLRLFLKNAGAFIKRRPDLDNLYGIGISIPGIYISSDDRVVSTKVPELETIPIRAEAEKLLGQPVSLVMKNVEAAALSAMTRLPDFRDRVIVYMFMGESVDGAVCDHGRFIRGAHEFGCDFGRMVLRYGELLETRIRTSSTDEMMANELSSAVYNIITILDPDAFIIESDLPREPDFLINNIKSALRCMYKLPEERIPTFITNGVGLRHSARGVAMTLRDKWLDSIL